MKSKHGLYLETLRLQNFATFQHEEIKFDKEFNAIIGETGSGKSLLLDALQIVFGARADKKLVRKGTEFAFIEASFSATDPDVKTYLTKIGHPCENNEIILKRIISSNGSSKSFLNYQQCPLQTLTEFSRRFIDLVGQFENQKLLNENYQLKLLDSFGSLEKLSTDYQKDFALLQVKKECLLEKQKNFEQLKQRQDYLEFQIRELDTLNPSVEDEQKLLHKKDALMSGHQNKEVLQKSLHLLSEKEDGNILSFLKQVEKLLQKAHTPIILDALEKIQDSQLTLQDVSFQLSRFSSVEVNEEELENILSRLDSYMKLKRKFNVDTIGLVAIYNDFTTELLSVTGIEEEIKSLSKEIAQIEKSAFTKALELHENRVRSSFLLSQELTKFVRKLKMDGATLKYNLIKSESLHRYGLNSINFEAETNPGEGYFKVKETASGGELSRILLAMRQILSSNDTISVFLFDEIDTGVGGETAIAIGKALEKVSFDSQVIAVTHLPQIANFGKKLIVVSKETLKEGDGPRTISLAQEFSGKQKNKFVMDMSVIH